MWLLEDIKRIHSSYQLSPLKGDYTDAQRLLEEIQVCPSTQQLPALPPEGRLHGRPAPARGNKGMPGYTAATSSPPPPPWRGDYTDAQRLLEEIQVCPSTQQLPASPPWRATTRTPSACSRKYRYARVHRSYQLSLPPTPPLKGDYTDAQRLLEEIQVCPSTQQLPALPPEGRLHGRPAPARGNTGMPEYTAATSSPPWRATTRTPSACSRKYRYARVHSSYQLSPLKGDYTDAQRLLEEIQVCPKYTEATSSLSPPPPPLKGDYTDAPALCSRKYRYARVHSSYQLSPLKGDYTDAQRLLEEIQVCPSTQQLPALPPEGQLHGRPALARGNTGMPEYTPSAHMPQLLTPLPKQRKIFNTNAGCAQNKQQLVVL